MVSFVPPDARGGDSEKEDGAQTPPGDVLDAVWRGRHAGEDALRAAYLALYQCESL